MKNSELRIGNLVSYNSEDNTEILPIDCIQSDNTVRLLKSGQSIGCFYADSIEPIPLTPEILEKAGFEYYAWPSFLDFTHYIKNDFILRETGSGYSFFNTSSCDNSERQFLVQLSYLHQLQNLYFALTGEELPIEL